jgi:predicted small lipoprotein YifL
MKCAAALLAILGLAGCGQTGPLYLPDAEIKTPVEIKAAPPLPATAPVQPAPVPEDETDEQPPNPPQDRT